jgi:hypothetical protein
MNIIEAIKSGKRFRRKNYYRAWFMARKDVYDIQPLNLDYASIVADDWEVEQTPVTITREQFDVAWRRALDVCENMEITTRHYLYELVVRELGL